MNSGAYILINTEVGLEDRVLESLKKNEYVEEAYITMGSYDVIAVIKASDDKDLRSIVTNHLRSVEGIRQALTLVVA